MIKAIIFDFAGVITVEGRFGLFTELRSKEFNTSPKELYEIIRKHWNLASIGGTSSEDFWNGIAADLKCDKQYFRKILINHMNINSKMVEFIKSLKGKYKIVLLSNQIKDWIEEKLDECELNDIFDLKIVSYDVKMRKPDKEIYLETLRQLELKPHECLFIDDKETNVTIAKEIGMNGITFINMEDFKEKIKEFL